MKKIIHKANDRGYADHGWLKSYHSFSFADYWNDEKINFGMLRVLNDDVVKAGMGFGTHGHDNMEIVSIPLSGSLAHKDSTGTAETIRTNDVQIMSAGTGIRHSEFNASETEAVNFLQIWIMPKERNIKPRYDQQTYSPEERHNRLLTVVSPEKSEKSLWINQDAYFSIGKFDSGQVIDYTIKKQSHGVYIFLIDGEVKVAETNLEKRDSIGIWATDSVSIEVVKNSQLLIIEVPMI